MQLLVVGATGGTGREVVRQGLDAGHDITAFVRSPAKLPQHQRLHIVTGSLPNDEAGFAEAARGKDAVISALGRGLSFKPEGLIERSVPALLSAMRSAGAQRLIFTSAFGVGDSIRDAPFFGRLFMRTLLRLALLDAATYVRKIVRIADQTALEALPERAPAQPIDHKTVRLPN